MIDNFVETDTSCLNPLTGIKFPTDTKTLRNCKLTILDKNDVKQEALVEPATFNDIQDISSWFESKNNLVNYADDKHWKEWWIDILSGKNQEIVAYKLTVYDNSLKSNCLGVIALSTIKDSLNNGKTTALISGIRVNPEVNYKLSFDRKYKKVGTALIKFACQKSLDDGLEQLGLNSSIGAEGFYRRLGLKEQIAFDGKRSYFVLSGNERKNLLQSQI